MSGRSSAARVLRRAAEPPTADARVLGRSAEVPTVKARVIGRSAAEASTATLPIPAPVDEPPTRLGPVVLGPRAGLPADGVYGLPDGALRPPRQGTVVFVSTVGRVEGSRGAAAALSCAGSGLETAALLIEVGGRVPRPTLIASASAHRLEERLAARLPTLRPAARGEVCHLAVDADEDGIAAAGVAATVARGGLVVVHLAPELLQPLLGAEKAPRPDSVLLRADLVADRPLVALAVGDLIGRKLRVAVLKRRLGWVAERRAGFGVLGSDSGGLPEPLLRRLLVPGARG
jgi:hypothetical protein